MKDIVPHSRAVQIVGLANRQTLNNWILRGRINGHKVEGRTCVSINECEKHMSKGVK